MHSRLVPQREFDPIVESYFVVDYAEVVPNDMRVDSKLFGYVAVF